MFHRYLISTIALTAAVLLSACANQSANQQVAGALIKAVEQTVRAGQSSSAPSGNTATDADYRRGLRSVHETELVNLFADKPLYLSGGKKALFPRVAITVDDAVMDRLKMPTSQQCYFMRARVWDSDKAFRDIRPFSVCGKDIQQPASGFSRFDNTLSQWNSGVATAGLDHTGNVRTEGPKFPMRGLPSGPLDAVSVTPSDLSFYFVHGTLTAMKFDWTQPDPRVWFVRFGKLDDSGAKALQEKSQQVTAPASDSSALASQKAVPVATKPPVTKPLPGSVLTYTAMLDLVTDDDELTRKRLIGRRIQLTLKGGHEKYFFVVPEDETYFQCLQRAPSFKGGSVTSTITNYRMAAGAAFLLLTLDRCQ